MKKLFTLLAFMTCFLGAKAANWVEVYSIDYSNNTGFPFYVMGYVPEWFDGVMTDFGAGYGYKTDDEMADFTGETEVGTVTTQGGVVYHKVQLNEPAWHQYFIADGIPTQLDGHYKVVALVKASEAVNVTVNMGWGWGDGQQMGGTASIPAGDDFTEVEWEYTGIGGASCNLVAQPGGFTGTIEWKSVTVYEDQKPTKPIVWQEWLTNDGNSIIPGQETQSMYMGDAETPWADPNVAFDDQEKNYLICAWSKEKGRNMNDKEGSDPFPADIEVDPDDPNNHVFVCHGKPATTEGDASAWDNQFWIQSPKPWKSGTQLKIHFRYKASAPVSSTDTQTHKQNPSDYLIWHAIGNIAFTTEWQEFDGTMTIADDMADGWSIAFNLNSVVKDEVTFYFDDLSWQSMVLDEGLFVASANTTTGLEYDFDNAVPFEWDEGLEAYVATAGTEGDKDSWVNELMISTVAGNDAAFKGNTISPSGSYIGEDEWGEYTAKSLSKIKLPAAGVWQIAVDTDAKQINIVKLEGEADKQPVDIVTNATEVVVNALEREYTEAEAEAAAIDKPEHPGAAWDNQFWIVANRTLEAGETTVVKFKYKATKAAKVTTQTHAKPGEYIHYAAIGDVNFEGGDDWQEFSVDYTIPSEAAGKNAQSIAFNLSEIKDANDYSFKDFQWYLKGAENEEGKTTENLINATGEGNFSFKVLGSEIQNSISSVKANVPVNVIYNIAGQKVNKNYKGLVIKNGSKYVVK